MAKTLLNGVNEVFKRVGIISGSQGELTSLTDSARQRYIDIAVQAWNEAVEDLYTTMDQPMPQELQEDTLTLVQDDRDYALAVDLVQLHFPLLDETNNHYIFEFSGKYLDLVNSQPNPSGYTGLPHFAVIRPTDGQLYMDRIPRSEDAGRVYKYRYDKDVSLSAFDDTFPFTDATFRAMVPAVAQIWMRDERNNFDQPYFAASIGRAARTVSLQQPRESWLNR